MCTVPADAPRRALEECCAIEGWSPASFRRAGEGRTSTVFVAPGLGVVLTVAPAGQDEAAVGARLHLARAVADRAPFVRPLDGVDQPVTTAHGVVSLWVYVPTVPTADLEAVGADIARFHAVDGADLEAGASPLGPARVMRDTTAWVEELADSGRLRSADVRTLSAVDRRLLTALGPPDRSSTGLLHGDLFWPNVLLTGHGAVLCDTDELGTGTPEHDVAFLFDPDRRSDPATDLEAFAAGYGSPVPDAATRRLLVRRTHLTFTLRLAERAEGARQRFWLDQWMAGWRRVAADDATSLVPPREHSRIDQLADVVRGPIQRWSAGRRPTA